MSLGLGVAGIQNNADGGLGNPIRLGQQADQIVSQLHARYYEQTVRGKKFSIHTQGTSITTTAALATTWTGLGIANASASVVNLVLTKFSACQFAVGAAATIGIMGGVGVLAASLTVQSRLIGSGTSAATTTTASAGATISTPILIQTFGSLGSLATTTYGLENGIYVDLDGSVIIPPGSFVCSYTSIVTTSALQFGFTWEEVPILR